MIALLHLNLDYWHNFSSFFFALSFFSNSLLSFLFSSSIPCSPSQRAVEGRLTWTPSPSQKSEVLSASHPRSETIPTEVQRETDQKWGKGRIQRDRVGRSHRGDRGLARPRSCGGGGDVGLGWFQPSRWKLLCWRLAGWVDSSASPPVGDKIEKLYILQKQRKAYRYFYLLWKANRWKLSFLIRHKDHHPDPVEAWDVLTIFGFTPKICDKLARFHLGLRGKDWSREEQKVPWI